MRVTPATFVHNRALRAVARAGVRIAGWRLTGRLPDRPKYLIIGAPHTSNWDFALMLCMALIYEIEFVWMGKHTLFKPPFGGLLRWMGGIPVDRTRSQGTVGRAVQAFRQSERLIMVIAPEGTRSRGRGWKRGFYHIAREAGVPIVMCYIDLRHRVAGIGPVFEPGESAEDDMRAILDFYRPYHL